MQVQRGGTESCFHRKVNAGNVKETGVGATVIVIVIVIVIV